MVKPRIILIGSASGIGKSTIASEISKELGIKYLIETDFIREVIRGIIGKEYIPTLHKSSFNAYTTLNSKLFNSEEELIAQGFIEHASAVIPGVEKVMHRAINDKDDVILEGVHLIPGLIDLDQFKDKALINFFILSVDEEVHKERFVKRATLLKRGGKHLDYFKENRVINNFLRKKAIDNAVPVINNENLEISTKKILSFINEECTKINFKHSVDDITIENQIVLEKYGGRIVDVLYKVPGFKEPLKRKFSVSDYEEAKHFTDSLKSNAKLNKDLSKLYELSNNEHSHTICAKDKETLRKIINELKDQGFVVEE